MNDERYQDWVPEQWAGEDPMLNQEPERRWMPDQWVGDQGKGPVTRRTTFADLTAGQVGISGYGHAARAAHWVPSR